MQKRRFEDINQEIEKTKSILIKLENELSTKFMEAINMACDSIVRGQMKWIPPLYLECEFGTTLSKVQRSILVHIKSYLMTHRHNTCKRKKCGCDILYGFVHLKSSDPSIEYELELNKLKNPIAIEIFNIPKIGKSGISCLSDDPLAFFKKYRFLTWYARHKQEVDQSNLKLISKSDLDFLMENFKYNPYFWMVYGKMMILGQVPSLHMIYDAEWALSCDPIPSNFNDLKIPDWMREKINRDGNNSFKSIVEREECRKITLSLVLCARQFSPDSSLYKDTLPTDMFKFIVILAKLIPLQWFY